MKNKEKILIGISIIAGGVGLYFGIKQFLKTFNKIKMDFLNENQKKMVNMLQKDVKPKFIELLKYIKDKGYDVIITSTYRSFAKSKLLHEQNSHNAKAGLSKHNYGMAMDINLIKNGKYWRKATSKGEWENTGIPAQARKLGFFWGGDYLYYHDPVHFEYPKGLHGSTLLAVAEKQFNSKDADDIIGNKIIIPNDIKKQYKI